MFEQRLLEAGAGIKGAALKDQSRHARSAGVERQKDADRQLVVEGAAMFGWGGGAANAAGLRFLRSSSD